MTQRERPRKSGYLSKLPVKGLMKKWIRRWFVLYGTSHEGVVRIEYYDTEELALNNVGKRTIPLRDCTGITTAPGNKVHPYVFQFTSQIGHHVLAAESQPEMDEWLSCLQDAVQEDKVRRRRSKTQSKVKAATSDSMSSSLNDSGPSYKNTIDSGTYRVTVEENDMSLAMNLSGVYSLDLTPSSINLVTPTGVTIFQLPYKFLKNYGKQSGQFHFLTGKNSPIGEGQLIFVTTCSKEIFGIVHRNIKALKEQLQGNRQASAEQKIKKPPPPKSGTTTRQQQPPQQSIGSRPSSSEITNTSVPGTYRTSRDLEELSKVTEEPRATTEGKVVATSSVKESQVPPIYAQVDKSRKKSVEKKGQEEQQQLYAQVDKSRKKSVEKKGQEEQQQLYAQVDKSRKRSVDQQQKRPQTKAPSPTKPANTAKTQEEAIYTDPFEADPAFRAPPVPRHLGSNTSNTARESRTSTMLVELDESAFDDSFDEDDDICDEYGDENLEPLAEGVMNPLDFGSLSDELTNIQSPGVSSNQQQTGAPPPPSAVPVAPPPPVVTPSAVPVAPPPVVTLSAVPVAPPPPVVTPSAVPVTSPPPPVTPSAVPVVPPPAPPPPTIPEAKATIGIEDLDFGFGPGKLEPTPATSTSKGEDNTFGFANFEPAQPTNPDKGGDTTFGFANFESAPSNNPDKGGDTAFGFANFESAPSNNPSKGEDNFADFNFDFGGDLPAVDGSDPFLNLSTTGAGANIAELDFNSLDTNFFAKLEETNPSASPWGNTGQANQPLDQQGFDNFWSSINT